MPKKVHTLKIIIIISILNNLNNNKYSLAVSKDMKMHGRPQEVA
jgi:hypothetical protein